VIGVSTNVAANAAVGFLNNTVAQEGQTLAHLSSGSRVVNASDDAAGLAIGTQLEASVTSDQQDIVDLQQGTSLLQSADGGMAQISSILQRMMALATEAASGQVTDLQRSQDLNTEYQQLSKQIDSIAASTQYGGQSLLTWQNQTNGFSWFSNSVMTNTYEALVIGNTLMGPANNAQTFSANTGFAYNGNLPGQYLGGAEGLPAGNSGTFNTGSLAFLVDSPAISSATFLTGPNADTSLNFSLAAINSTTLGLASNIVSYQATAMDPNTIVVGGKNPLTAAQYLALHPDADYPGGVTTTVTNVVSGIATQSAAMVAISTLDAAIGIVSQARARVGAYESRFNFSSQDLQTNVTNLQSSASVIMDADVAANKAQLSATDVQAQGSIAALSQASALPRLLLRFLND